MLHRTKQQIHDWAQSWAPLMAGAAIEPSRRDLLRIAAAFLCLQGLLVFAGFALRPAPFGIAVYWPASGLLATTLFLTQRRYWPWLLVAALLAEVSTTWIVASTLAGRSLTLFGTGYFALCHLAEGVAIAYLAQRFATRVERPDVVRTLLSVTCLLVGTGLSALLAAPLLAAIDTRTSTLDNVLSWFLSDFTGTLMMAPLIVSVLAPHLSRGRGGPAGIAERVAVAMLVLLGTVYVFAWDADGARHVLQFPVVIVVPFIWAAVRTGPVSIAWLCLLSAAVPPILANIGYGLPSFSGEESVLDVVQVQFFFAILTIGSLLLAALNDERQMAWRIVNASNDRYRHFLQHSSEAVWRIDLREPMPTDIELDAQAEWIKEHAVLAEHNEAYRRTARPTRHPQAEFPVREPALWLDALRMNLQAAAANDYRLEGIELDLDDVDGEPSVWRASIVGHVAAGRLERFWGIAQDITESKRHQTMSATSQARVKGLIQRLEAFEHSARRSFASELHDGPAQTLAGAEMLLATLRASLPADKRPVLEQARSAVGNAIAELRELMTEYWPRNLKGDDIAQALRQLIDSYRRRDDLEVNFAIVGRLDDLPDKCANMLYGALRELLRNVVKHAGGARCTVALFRTNGAIEMRVRDYGTSNVVTHDFANGFGLLSLRERAESLDGTLSIAARDNGGTLVTLRIPLAGDEPLSLPA